MFYTIKSTLSIMAIVMGVVFVSLLVHQQSASAAYTRNAGECNINIGTQDFCSITAGNSETLKVRVNEGYDANRMGIERHKGSLGYLDPVPTATNGIIEWTVVQVVSSTDSRKYIQINPIDGNANFYYFGVFGSVYEDANSVDKRKMRDTFRAAATDNDCDNNLYFPTGTAASDKTGAVAECKKNIQTPGLIWEQEASTFEVQKGTGSWVTYYIHDNSSPFWSSERTAPVVHRDPVNGVNQETPQTPQAPQTPASQETTVISQTPTDSRTTQKTSRSSRSSSRRKSRVVSPSTVQQSPVATQTEDDAMLEPDVADHDAMIVL